MRVYRTIHKYAFFFLFYSSYSRIKLLCLLKFKLDHMACSFQYSVIKTDACHFL